MRQLPIPIRYRELEFDEGFRADNIVGRKVLLELKSLERLAPVHFKQTLTYAKLHGARLAFLLNLGEKVMKSGIHRIVNGLDVPNPDGDPSPGS